MKSIEEICDLCNLEPEDIEEKLYALLSYYADTHPRPAFEDNSLKGMLDDYLIERNCIIREGLDIDVTPKGFKLLQRGWITRNYEKQKEQEINDLKRRKRELVYIGITAFATAITAILAFLQFLN